MPPPNLTKPEWFLKYIVNREVMREIGGRLIFYDDLFEEIIYRAHHNSIKVAYADIFYKDFQDVARACGLKKNYYKYLPKNSTLRYMIEENRRFSRYLKKKNKKHEFFGDIRWSFPFWLSQLSFWYITVKSFYDVWRRVVFENYSISIAVSWRDAITLYIIYNFTNCYKNYGEKCVRKKWVKRYAKYFEIEQEEQRKSLKTSLS